MTQILAAAVLCCLLWPGAARAQSRPARGRRLLYEAPYRDMDPEFDTCDGARPPMVQLRVNTTYAIHCISICSRAGVKYEDQGWYKLDVPLVRRAPVAALQQLATLAPLLDNSTGAEVCSPPPWSHAAHTKQGIASELLLGAGAATRVAYACSPRGAIPRSCWSASLSSRCASTRASWRAR